MSHANSSASILDFAASGDLSRRATQIYLAAVDQPDRPWTDRDMLERLGYRDMNAVRPRITEMVSSGLLIETGSVECQVTGKTVRTWRAALVEEYQETRARIEREAAAQPELALG